MRSFQQTQSQQQYPQQSYPYIPPLVYPQPQLHHQNTHWRQLVYGMRARAIHVRNSSMATPYLEEFKGVKEKLNKTYKTTAKNLKFEFNFETYLLLFLSQLCPT